jgi:hypothetical protein
VGQIVDEIAERGMEVNVADGSRLMKNSVRAWRKSLA